MIAIDLITEDIPPLTHLDTGEKALRWMDEFRVSHLPVLKNGNFVGLLSESDVLDKMDEKQTLDVLFEHLPRPFVWATDHLYEVVAKMGEYSITVLPVLDKDEKYLGSTCIHELIQAVSNIGGIKDPGGIIVLEVDKVNYSLAQISQIVESNNAKILSSYVYNLKDSNQIEVTIKINETDLERIIRTFLRYEYVIKASYQRTDSDDDLKDRFDALMKFMKF
ncbi:MAG: CBS domain-containing protein [Crocinitomicaceae bacterium]|nr:CBS domain-containing protein [Crocinitomicaceae bacterium]